MTGRKLFDVLPCGFDPAKSRGKFRVPMWADAFLRDTMDMSAEEIGAYHLIIYAMWKRENCDLPNDPRRLSRIARVSTRAWNSRVGPAITSLLSVTDSNIISAKLQKEALETERHLIAQHRRKCELCKLSSDNSHISDSLQLEKELSKKTHNLLENNNRPPTGVTTGDKPSDRTPEKPSQHTNIRDGGGGTRARDDLPDQTECLREQILGQIGADPVSGLSGPTGKILGTFQDMTIANRWKDDLGLTDSEIVTIVGEVMRAKPDGPPASFRYFDQAMQRAAGAKSRPKLTPIEGGSPDGSDVSTGSTRRQSQQAKRRGPRGGSTHSNFLAAFAGPVPEDD